MWSDLSKISVQCGSTILAQLLPLRCCQEAVPVEVLGTLLQPAKLAFYVMIVAWQLVLVGAGGSLSFRVPVPVPVRKYFIAEKHSTNTTNTIIRCVFTLLMIYNPYHTPSHSTSTTRLEWCGGTRVD